MNPIEGVLEFLMQLFRVFLQFVIDMLMLVIGLVQSVLHMIV